MKHIDARHACQYTWRQNFLHGKEAAPAIGRSGRYCLKRNAMALVSFSQSISNILGTCNPTLRGSLSVQTTKCLSPTDLEACKTRFPLQGTHVGWHFNLAESVAFKSRTAAEGQLCPSQLFPSSHPLQGRPTRPPVQFPAEPPGQ